jgi:magnesium chelatase family protein
MLAQRFAALLPDMTLDDALESAAVASLAGRFELNQWMQRPTRSPHHTATSVALVGGGTPPRPGEISLAHNGVLFLDELAEVKRSALEALREPLENGHITISRAATQAKFPARFQLIAAMNLGFQHESLSLHTRPSVALPRQAQRPFARPHRLASGSAHTGHRGVDAQRAG